jgi:ribosomal-protein-alanine N-acetyltransferase
MILQTARLILRPFQAEDIGRLAELMANSDFTRFSLGPYTREQTETVLQKFLAWNKARLPSQFAVVLRDNESVLGYCGFLHHPELPEEVEIDYRLDATYWNRGLITEAACAVRDYAFLDFKLTRVISLIHPEKHSFAPRGGENWYDAGKGNYVSRLSDDCVCVISGTMAFGPRRSMNSRASAR